MRNEKMRKMRKSTFRSGPHPPAELNKPNGVSTCLKPPNNLPHDFEQNPWSKRRGVAPGMQTELKDSSRWRGASVPLRCRWARRYRATPLHRNSRKRSFPFPWRTRARDPKNRSAMRSLLGRCTAILGQRRAPSPAMFRGTLRCGLPGGPLPRCKPWRGGQ